VKRLADTYFNTAKQLDPVKWNPSKARAVKKKKEDVREPDPFGINQDLGDPKSVSHIKVLKGGVTSDFTPKYDDAFADDDKISNNYLKSNLIAKRRNPFDTFNWGKLKVKYVATDTTSETL